MIQGIGKKARGVQTTISLCCQDGCIRRWHRSLRFLFELTIVTHFLDQIGSASFEVRAGEDDDASGSLICRFDSMKAPSTQATSEAVAT